MTQDIERAKQWLNEAEHIAIGGGAGLSAAAGLQYGGARFHRYFADFEARYGMTDMYSAGFYPFPTQEEKWAYWSRHIVCNRFDPPALPLYRALYALVKDKDYFAITTNVDGQFEKAGFPEERLFCVQGDYGLLQCAKGCHSTLYPDEALMREMVRTQRDGKVPTSLVPKCPVCGGEMEVHIRKDAYFVQDAAWDAANDRYERFLAQAKRERTVLLELGVGFNTPTIIRFPFEQMTYRRPQTRLIRINLQYPDALAENADKTISLGIDLARAIEALATP